MIEDEKIIELFFGRSEQGIRELDIKYGKVCHKLSYNIVNSRQDAEECVNDAYLGAWNAIPPAKPDPLLSYICKIVRNISLKNYYRKEAAKRNSTYTIAMEEIEACIADPNTVEAEIEARELARIMERFLDTLTVKNRVIFMRRYWFSDSCKDIAEFVGLSEKNISVRLTRIRQKMKKLFSRKRGIRMNSKKFSEAMSELDTKYMDEAINYKKKAQKPIWVKWGVVAACLAFVCVAAISLFPRNNDRVTTPGIADAAPMIYVNDTLYKQSASQTSFNQWKEDFVYLGIIETDVTNFQGTDNAGNYLDGIPKENFQANHPIVGAGVYQYGDDIVVEIEGKYWLYEIINDNF